MNKIAKAIIAAVTSGAGALGTALADGSLSAVETVTFVVAAVVAFFAVWATPNEAEVKK